MHAHKVDDENRDDPGNGSVLISVEVFGGGGAVVEAVVKVASEGAAEEEEAAAEGGEGETDRCRGG